MEPPGTTQKIVSLPLSTICVSKIGFFPIVPSFFSPSFPAANEIEPQGLRHQLPHSPLTGLSQQLQSSQARDLG